MIVRAIAVAALLAAAMPANGAASWQFPHGRSRQPINCVRPTVTDGDTIRCANLRQSVRLLGIDAPELPGHCRRGRACVEGDPVASRDALAAVLRSGRVTVTITGRDRYGRNLAVVRTGGVNLSCTQIAGGYAVFVPRWDTQGRIAGECF